MISKPSAKVLSAWTNSTFRTYVATLFEITSWKVALAVALTLCWSAAQGAQLLLLVPLMKLIGLDVQQGSVSWIDRLVSSVFATFGLRPSVLTVLGALILSTVMLASLGRWQRTFHFKLREDFVTSLRRQLYRAIAGTNWLAFSRRRSSDFIHGLTDELSRVGDATYSLLYLSSDTLLVAVYILFALWISPSMSVLAFISGAGLLLLLRSKSRAAGTIGEDVSEAYAGVFAAATEHMGGMKTVKSYNAEERNIVIFSRLVEKLSQTRISWNRNYADSAFWSSVGSVLILSIILFVSLEISDLAPAGLILLLYLLNRMIPLLGSMQESYLGFVGELPAFARVWKMKVCCEATAQPKGEQLEVVELSQGIRLEEVCFSYDDRETLAIHKLNLTIEAGKTTAIVGPSGAGKSTVADLVMGLIVLDRGRVLVDEMMLGPERIRSWRSRIGYVTQDTFLFHDTIRANLLWASPEANDEEINRALRLAAAKEFVSELPEGLETILGDRGVRLSGGERQRLALARALLRKPSLLILDEATSALDSENEKRILSAIEELRGHMTILVIAHRLPTVRRADIIYVLEQGTVVEAGDWNTLIERENGRFNALGKAQGITTTSR